MMLGLSLHEPRVVILRERVEDKKKGRGGPKASKVPEVKGMDFLRMDRLRQYLLREFAMPLGQPGVLPFPFDLERIIDDFVFLCFFVGNDFLPHLPCLEIREGGLDMMLLLYKHILPLMGGYICTDGSVDLHRVEMLVQRLALVESNIFRRRAVEEQRSAAFAQQRNASNAASAASAASLPPRHTRFPGDGQDDAAADEAVVAGLGEVSGGGGAAFHEEGGGGGVEEESILAAALLARSMDLAAKSGDGTVKLGEAGWRDRYYKNKLREEDSPEARRAMALSYVQGLCWVALYYTQGVPSWSWFYPFHYAPFACDLTNLAEVPRDFELGQPFPPLTQLMAVLPAASSHCVPEAYKDLMESPESPVADCYPTTFEMDPNGKPPNLTWLWVARLPFLDAPRLVGALEGRAGGLSPEERARNQPGGAELMVSVQHPAGAAPVQALARGGSWVDIAGLRLGGQVKDPALLGSGVKVVRYSYAPPPGAFHSSRVHDSFASMAEPLEWPRLEASLPRRKVRLPLWDDELEAMLAGHAPRPGKGGKGDKGGKGGKGGGGGVCFDFQSAAGCQRGASCRFAHHAGPGGGGGGGPPPPPPRGQGSGGSGGGGGGSSGGTGTAPCHFFNSPQGCKRGANCKFSHGA